MDSATSHHHDASDEHTSEVEVELKIEVDAFVAALDGMIGDRRARGSVLLSEALRPPRAFLGNPPRSAQKKPETGRSDPERGER